MCIRDMPIRHFMVIIFIMSNIINVLIRVNISWFMRNGM